MNIIIWGYGIEGVKLYRELVNDADYKVIGFADNSIYKQGNIVGKFTILSMQDLLHLKLKIDFSVIIAARQWFIVGEELEKHDISIEGIYQNGSIAKYDRMTFKRLDFSKNIMLYAGDICDDVHMSNPNLYGLSINKSDSRHILHDITVKYPLPDESIYSYQAEDVLEHIEYDKLVDAINEIYRILKQGGLLRICFPDYFSPYLDNITMKNKEGGILFDPTGEGNFGEDGVENGGHVWFPNYKNVMLLLENTMFNNISLLCYHTETGELVRKGIDFDKGYINRIPRDIESEGQIYSIVVDCYK